MTADPQPTSTADADAIGRLLASVNRFQGLMRAGVARGRSDRERAQVAAAVNGATRCLDLAADFMAASNRAHRERQQ